MTTSTDQTWTDTTPAPSAMPAGLLGAALAYAAVGWHVIPLRPGGKRPAFPDHTEDTCTGRDPRCARAGTHVGWQERATTDPDRITRAWSRPTTAGWFGIGIACGPSGLLVVDLDVPKSDLDPAARARLEHQLNQYGLSLPATGADVLAVILDRAGQHLSATYTVTTPSGGRHLYFTTPPGLRLGNTARLLGPLIDTRAIGGQVVAPPTRIPDGSYVVAEAAPLAATPTWLSAALTPTPRPTDQARPVTGIVQAPDRYLRAAVTAELRRITEAGEGGRNHALLVAAIALGQLVAGGALVEDDVRALLTHAAAAHVTAGAYSAHQANSTITSGLRRGATNPRRPPSTAA